MIDQDDVTGLYPAIEPYATGQLKVSDLHEMYYEEAGNPKGKPVVFLHGGPGTGIMPRDRRFFHPEKYRIVLFDQRGCGKSTPPYELRENTTWHLVEDIEKLRKHLGIEQWQVFGGSWGSTLSLAYGMIHPECVTEMVLRGIFFGNQDDCDWFTHGAGNIFPDKWEAFIGHLPENERHDVVGSYYTRFLSEDPAISIPASRAWVQWEIDMTSLIPEADTRDRFSNTATIRAMAIFEAHYIANGCFWKSENQIIESIAKMRHVPCTIVHGRYDMVCRVKRAWELHKAWPGSALHIIPDAGHSTNEPGISRALVAATDQYASA